MRMLFLFIIISWVPFTGAQVINNFDYLSDFSLYEPPTKKETNLTEFMFARGKYENSPAGGSLGHGEWWKTDYPDSDKNFLRGVARYTVLDVTQNSFIEVELGSDKLFEYPFLYLNFKRVPIETSNAGPNFTEEEAANLREYMLRGGFVLIDDFWGDVHWDEFLIEYLKIFPDRDFIKIYPSINEPLFHSFFDVDEIYQIPGGGVTWENSNPPVFRLDDPEYSPSIHVVYGDDGNIMMVINHNTDLGDGWEHTFLEGFPTKYINEAYKLGINYIIYSLSH